MRTTGHRLLAASLAAAAACSGSAVTEIVIEARSDLAAPAEIDQVQFTVKGPGLDVQRQKAIASPADFPLTLALVWKGGPLDPLSVEVSGLLRGEIRAREARPVRWKRGQIVRERFDLTGTPAPDAGAEDARPDRAAPDVGAESAPDRPLPGDTGGERASTGDGPAPAEDRPARLEASAEAPEAGRDLAAERPPPDAAPDLGGCPSACTCQRSCGTGSGCTCAGACPCEYTCVVGEDCEARCRDRNTTCTVRAARAANVVLVCTVNARCIVNAMGASNLTAQCRDSTCELDCTGVSNCRVTCEDRAQCLIRCTPGNANCRFDKCEGQPQQTCPDGRIACGPCPL